MFASLQARVFTSHSLTQKATTQHLTSASPPTVSKAGTTDDDTALLYLPRIGSGWVAFILGDGGTLATEPKVKLVETGLLPVAAKTIGVPANIDDRMRAYGVPGISIAIVDNGKIAWAKGYGVADSSSRRPVTTQTLFQAASISKPLSAMGALLLVQKGLVNLDDDVNAALKSWTIPANDLTRASPVTLRMLLNHTSGAVHSGLSSYPPYTAGDDLPTLLQILKGELPARRGPIEIVSLPGRSFSYSGAGYEILQQVIVDVSAKPFEEFMQSEVLRPLGMTSSTFAQPLPESLLPIVATGHYAGGRAMPGRFRISPELTAAGLWSTPTDIAKYLVNVRQIVRRSSGGAVEDGSNASNAKSRSPQPRARPCHQRRRGFHSLWS